MTTLEKILAIIVIIPVIGLLLYTIIKPNGTLGGLVNVGKEQSSKKVILINRIVAAMGLLILSTACFLTFLYY
ncbi:hypothetical protein [Clostridium fallax]|uniref:Uncharacterized protein n=1 Tax=Clostridium fallax TaxID=1533 RepID=A0A1M4W9F0_9CLOT|nr:hypothetical protein [Clostridium fallax]SHE77891.1 hypothetical protein SAMN05443638_11125 [Clostridium fallax]SQB05939.1 Uncharacterised protein [Clostridium fallax]